MEQYIHHNSMTSWITNYVYSSWLQKMFEKDYEILLETGIDFLLDVGQSKQYSDKIRQNHTVCFASILNIWTKQIQKVKLW